MTEFHKKSKSKLWCFGASNCFKIGENLRRQALSKDFNTAHTWKRKSSSRFMKAQK